MAKETTAKASPAEAKRAQDMWEKFTHASKWSVISITGILIVLCLLFIV